jgi:hypothetical protein
MDFRLSHTSAVMAICPLCSERSGKRYCPAKDVQICAVCCGTKREIEIDCPSSCGYLKASRSYEAEKPVVDSELAAKVRKYDERFFNQYQDLLNAANRAIAEERLDFPWLVDSDVVEALKALRTTMQTLSTGLYYESLPDSTVRVALFRKLKQLFDKQMQPESADDRPLKVSEAIDVLDFLTFAALVNSGVRPRSRRYLDWICETFGYEQPRQSSGLIIP